jgi:nucleoside-diphosphate-sugar epimerase
MAKLLIIGGTGFFGKSILDSFQSKSLDNWNIAEIIVLARQAESLRISNPELINEKISLINADISTINELPFADFVIHAAASTNAKNYYIAPLKEREKIILGTLNYCKLAKKFHQKSKIVYVSSGAVYGLQPPNIDELSENFNFFDVNQLPENKRDYAIAKRDSEDAIFNLSNDGLNVSIARCFAFLGRWLPLDQHFAIGNFMANILKKTPIKVDARNQVYRSYMHSDDLVKWLLTIASYSSPDCPIFNVGSDEEFLLHDLAKKISKKYGVGLDIKAIDHPFIDRYIPSIKKAKSILGLSLSYDLEDSLDLTLMKLKSSKYI